MMHVFGDKKEYNLAETLKWVERFPYEPLQKIQPLVDGVARETLAMVEQCLIGEPSARPTARDLFVEFSFQYCQINPTTAPRMYYNRASGS
jgi:hypothetical protein